MPRMQFGSDEPKPVLDSIFDAELDRLKHVCDKLGNRLTCLLMFNCLEDQKDLLVESKISTQLTEDSLNFFFCFSNTMKLNQQSIIEV